MTASLAGQHYELVHDDQRAVVVEVGAGLREYHTGIGDIVDGYGADEECDGSRGQLLLPWPNRIADATYRFEGEEFRLPVTEPRTGCAIHGLTRAMPWRRIDASSQQVTLALDLPPQDGYPFRLGLSATYSLGGDGLTVCVTATNQGDQACPYGAGAHPYIRLAGDGLIDDAWLHIPAEAVLESDARGIPIGAELPVEGTAFDFRNPRRLGSLVLDTAFARLHGDDDGTTRIALTTPGGQDGVLVWMDATHRYAMVYSGDTLGNMARRRRGLAVEPMTCAPDAFNSGAGLIVLQPGEVHTSNWGIAPL